MDRKFNVEMATVCDVKAALVVDFIRDAMFVDDPEKDIKFIDGRPWVRCSRRKIAEYMGFMSEDSVRNATCRLVCKDIIRMAHLSDNRFDNTYWYSITDHGNKIMTSPKYAAKVIRNRGQNFEI